MIGSMAEWFVGPIMDKIINACVDYLQDHVKWQTGMKETLERLQKLHPMIQSVVFAYNQTQIGEQNPALNRWLWQLRDAIDEADDLLDEFEYLKHKEQLSRNMEETKKRKAFFNTSFLFESAHKFYKGGDRALKNYPYLKRLEEVVQNLDKVSAGVANFLHLLESTKQDHQEKQFELYRTRETGSLPKNDLIGRVKDKEFVMQWLRKPSNEHRTTLYRNISLLSIVGHGGMGKTTLLQHVYEDEMTKEFDLKMWVCVSNKFDVKKVIADMLESVKKERPRLESLHTLQESLKSEVMSKKFLLVLDDIWEEQEEQEERDKRKWENVLAPLAYGSLGSKILITTRMDSVVSMIAKVIKKKKESYKLDGLEEDECLQLLNSHAFVDEENPDDHKKLRSIAGEIVKKLSGSPLAAKVTGGVLNSNLDERHWIKVLNSDFGSVELIQNDIFPILRLSYIFLPIPLQNCFAYCCVFPQDHEFDKEALVRMWIALGFIQTPYIQEEIMEDIGEKYFDALVKKSFFDKFQTKNRTFYKMHDLLYELAQSVTTQECLRVVDDENLSCRIPDTIRHLSVRTSNLEVLRRIRKFKNLRSLLLTHDTDNPDFVDALTEIFEASSSIRLLYINDPHIKIIPEAIEYLIHLRYFKIARTRVTMLPRSISKLYHLQFIIYDNIDVSLPNNFLPEDINNLSNLHLLKLPYDNFPQMHEVGKLKSLQKLNGFYIENKAGYRIGELEHMNMLRQLSIKLLKNVKDAEEVCKAELCDKRNLTDLSLEWGDIWKPKENEKTRTSRNIVDPDLDEKVLDNLQPHHNLKKVKIHSFMGVRSAIWMNNMNLMSNLEYIQLDECLEWQILPPFGQLPYLKSLYLYNMPKVKRLDNKFHGNDKDCVFPSLEMLDINKMEALEVWFDDAAAAANDCLFPCLTELCLKDSPNLQELPSLPPKLMKLKIDNIGWKAFIWLQSTSNCCIQELTIKGNDELSSFPIEAGQWFRQVSSSLCELKFYELKFLQSLPSSLESLSSLKVLCVYDVPHLQQLPDIPGTLEELELEELETLQCLPSSLSISSLKHIQLKSIPLIKLLPDLPPSLELIELQELKSLLCMPSFLSTVSSLKTLILRKIPLLNSLSDLPSSLQLLKLEELESLQCLPSSLSTISSLKNLILRRIPLLKSLPDLPPSLCGLYLQKLENLDCLPSCLPCLYSLRSLDIHKVPQLRELPDLSPSLEYLSIIKCHPELLERYDKFTGSDWHKIAHILHINISNRNN